MRALILGASLLLGACGGGGGYDGGSSPGQSSGYSVGGMVSGLTGTVVLQDNGTDNLSISANGPFTFATRLGAGATYNVTVLTQPMGKTCAVANGNNVLGPGGYGAMDVTNVTVTCT